MDEVIEVPNGDGTSTRVIPDGPETAQAFRAMMAAGYTMQQVVEDGSLIYGVDFGVEGR
jgi:hypothetical protein